MKYPLKYPLKHLPEKRPGSSGKKRGWEKADTAMSPVSESVKKRETVPGPIGKDSLHFLDIAAVEDHLWLATAQGAVLHSSDAGLTWERQWPQWPEWSRAPMRRFTQVQFLDTTNGFLGGSRGAFLSTRDGGRTWLAHPDAGITGEVRGIHFVDSLKGLAIDGGDRAFLTFDGARTWRQAEALSGKSLRTIGIVRTEGESHYLYFSGLEGRVIPPGLESAAPVSRWVPGRPSLRAVHFIDTAAGLCRRGRRHPGQHPRWRPILGHSHLARNFPAGSRRAPPRSWPWNS